MTVKSVALGEDISDDTSRRATRPCGAAWCRRYSYEEWNLLTGPIAEGGESGAIVADPVGAAWQCSETPAVGKMWVSSRRYSRLI